MNHLAQPFRVRAYDLRKFLRRDRRGFEAENARPIQDAGFAELVRHVAVDAPDHRVGRAPGGEQSDPCIHEDPRRTTGFLDGGNIRMAREPRLRADGD